MSKRKKKHKIRPFSKEFKPIQPKLVMDDPSKLDKLPVTYQAITDYFGKLGEANPFILRKEAFLRIERITGRPLICYVTKTHNLPQGIPAYDDSDLNGFGPSIYSVFFHKNPLGFLGWGFSFGGIFFFPFSSSSTLNPDSSKINLSSPGSGLNSNCSFLASLT
jgi:hypothetical protein